MTEHDTTPSEAAPHERTDVAARGPVRLSTVTLGLVLLLVAGGVLAARLGSLTVEPSAVVVVLLLGAGLVFLASAASTARR